MQNKKIILIFAIIVAAILGGIYFIYTKEDKTTTLNLLEKQWIEKNKNNVIDMGIVSNIPIFTDNGSGLYFDFLTSLADETGLSFNYVPFQINESDFPEYSFSITSKLEKGDILVYKDNYVLVGRTNLKVTNPSTLSKATVAVINSDLGNANKFLNNNNLLFKTYDDYAKLMEAFTKMDVVGDGEDEVLVNEIDYVIIPKTLYFKEISENNFYINYHLTEMNKYYSINLGKEKRLNDILTKYFEKWSTDNFNSVFSNHFSLNYFKNKVINEKETVDFRSRRYTYGYIEDLPLNFSINGKLYGSVVNLLDSFSKHADVEINYQKYKNIDLLNKALNDKKVDLMINYKNADKNISTNILSRDIVVLSSRKNNIVVNSINSLVNKEVKVLKNTFEEKILIDAKAKVKTYNTLEELVNSANSKSVMVISKEAYNVYLTNKLASFKVDYEESIGDYNFAIRDVNENKVFNDYLDFYLAFSNYESLFNKANLDIINNYGKINVKLGLYISVALFFAIAIVSFVLFKFAKRNVKKTKAISKEDKLRYIDMLTSLKNRNYLNDNLEAWDSSEVYPQAILVVDLNNVAYINDNYGHAEGDNVIREAANILIMTQEPGSDIIRTSGNEFLIYLVGHDEKSVVAYKRKLTKEFRDISHGFGAAIGYSMILDGIKTIDDAINEATLDMRNNKESQNN